MNQQNKAKDTTNKPKKNGSNKSKFERISEFLDENYDLRFNEMLNEWERKVDGVYVPYRMADIDFDLFEANFTGFDRMLSAYLGSSKRVRYNPIQEYFKNLPTIDPDEPDYLTEYCSFIKTDDDKWFRKMLEKHLLRTISQCFQENYFNKHCLVFHGEQNNGKTSAIRYFAPDPLKRYEKTVDDIRNKDARIELATHFFLNFDELDKMSPDDIAKVKSLMSLDRINERIPHDKYSSSLPRRATFWGTTNKTEFLVDETGNVRWIVIMIKKINHDNGGPKGYKSIPVDKIWAQMYALWQKGEKGGLSSSEIKEIEKRSSKYRRSSIEMEIIPKYYEPTDKKDPDPRYMTATDVKLEIESKVRVLLNRERIGTALRALGFIQIPARIPGNKESLKVWLIKKMPEIF
nr:VapE domain-containing protein [uncultured Arsenicibacter sp.]